MSCINKHIDLIATDILNNCVRMDEMNVTDFGEMFEGAIRTMTIIHPNFSFKVMRNSIYSRVTNPDNIKL